MALVAQTMALRSRLEQKGAYRPNEMVRKKLPDGTALLAELPSRDKEKAAGDRQAEDAWVASGAAFWSVLFDELL